MNTEYSFHVDNLLEINLTRASARRGFVMVLVSEVVRNGEVKLLANNIFCVKN